jgi:O-antigen/teichoic acid export membrane protein
LSAPGSPAGGLASASEGGAGPPVEDAAAGRSYGSGARILSIGIAATGVFTFAYFAVSSHVLNSTQYGGISTLWAILFVTISVIYRPVEQLLSRTIADARARGVHQHELRGPATIQLAFAALFLVVALALHVPLRDKAFSGSEALYWILVGATLAYAGSYFARGYLAGHQWFGLYGGLVLFESLSRFCFPVAVAIGVASGQTVVALGILAAPVASLLVVPWALRRHASGGPRGAGATRASTSFAVSVAAIQLAEQTLVTIGVLLVPDAALRGIVFNALLIARAPLQLFQAVQTSLLPHLAGLEATEDAGSDRAIRVTIMSIASFAGACAVGLLLIGPWVMDVAFGKGYDYGRVGLAAIALGMGFHLTAGTLNQAALAGGRAAQAARSWLIAAAAFVVWMLLPVVDNRLARAEAGYLGASMLLCAQLYVLYRATRRPVPRARPASPPV